MALPRAPADFSMPESSAGFEGTAVMLREILPEGVIPRHYRHVDEFPLNANRKIDRKALAGKAAELLAPAPVA